MSFVTAADVDTYQVLWEEYPLSVVIANGAVSATVYPGPEQATDQNLLFASLPVEPELYYSLTLSMDNTNAVLIANDLVTSFYFPLLYPDANPDWGESPQGPPLFAQHMGPVYIGCQPQRYTVYAGGLGGSSVAEYECPAGEVVSLDVNFEDFPGRSLAGVKVTCMEAIGTADSDWLGNPPPPDGNYSIQTLDLLNFTAVEVQYGDLVDSLNTTTTNTVGANSSSDDLSSENFKLLDCHGAPVRGIRVRYGDHIDAISLLCDLGNYFAGQLLSAVRWRHPLSVEQLARSAASLGGVVWDFRNISQLQYWTVVEQTAEEMYYPKSIPNGTVL